MASGAVQYTPPVPPSLHGVIALLLLMAGFIASAVYCAKPRSGAGSGGFGGFVVELAVAAVASVLLGFGSLFLALWSGIWV